MASANLIDYNTMRQKITFLLIGIIFGIWHLAFGINMIRAEPDCNNPGFGDYDYCIQKLQRDIDALSPAQEKNKADLASLNKQISDLNSKITKLTTVAIIPNP